MPVLIATAGAPDANSYCTVAEADAYFAERLYTEDWDAALVDAKEKALIMATSLLDRMYIWSEETYPTSADQALQWPRVGMLAANQLEYIPEDIIPRELKEATAEYAKQLLVSDRTADNTIEGYGLTSLSAGPVSMAFRDTVVTKTIPDAVYYTFPPWWGRIRGTGGTRELLRS